MVDFRKILTNFFKAAAVSLVSYSTGGMLFYRDFLNLRATSRISSFGVFWSSLILYGKNRTDLTIRFTLFRHVSIMTSIIMRFRA